MFISERYSIPLLEGLGLGHENEKIVPVRDLEGTEVLDAVSAAGVVVR